MLRVILNPAEINRLAREFEAGLGNFPRLNFALGGIGIKLAAIVPPAYTLDQAIRTVLMEAQERVWLRELLRSIAGDRATYGDGFADACESAISTLDSRAQALLPYAPADPKTALLMENGEPFVDRDALRQKLSDFVHATAGTRVFVVRGPSGAGKSHLWHFFNHLVDRSQTDYRTYLDVTSMIPGPVGARDLMTRIGNRMSLDTDLLSTDRFAQEARVAEKLCDWFVGQAQGFQQRGHRWWIVIDGLDAPFLTDGAMDLVLKLAIAVARQEAPCCHLLLLGLKDPLPSAIKNIVADEILDGLTRADVSLYIDRLASSLGRTIAPEELQDFTSRTLSGQGLPFGHAEMDAIKVRLMLLPGFFKSLPQNRRRIPP